MGFGEGIKGAFADWQERNRQTYGLLISGGVAGSVAKTATAPLSRLTILFQVHSMVTTKPHAPQYADSLLAGLQKVVGKEGVLAFWKGNGTSVMHRFPYSAINFHAYETTSSALRSYFSRNSTSISNSGGFQGTANSGAEATIRFMSGALAGGVATVACYPLDLVRTRLTTQVSGSPAHYRGIGHALQRIVVEEGPFGLYNGLGITLLVQVPNLAISYSAYGFIRDRAMSWIEAQNQRSSYSASTATAAVATVERGGRLSGAGGGKGDGQSPAPNLDSPASPVGVIAPEKNDSKMKVGGRADATTADSNEKTSTGAPKKTLTRRFTRVGPSAEDALLHDDDHLSLFEPGADSTTGDYGPPQQQWQQKKQHSSNWRAPAGTRQSSEGSGSNNSSNSSSTAGRAAAPSSGNNGSSGSMRSSEGSNSSSSSSSSASDRTSTASSEAQPEGNAQLAPAQMAVNLGAGALSGVISTLCIYPLDVIRRRMQLQSLHRPAAERNSAVVEALGIIRSEGARGLYRGLTPELCKIMPMVAITFSVYEYMKDYFGVVRC